MEDLLLRDLLAEATAKFEKAGIDSPALSAHILAEKALGTDRLKMVLDMLKPVDSDSIQYFNSMVKRRLSGEPAAYILGEKEFYGLPFKVGAGVLIPRPETEEIIEAIQEIYKPNDSFLFADFGTGSGILAVTIASLFKNSKGIAIDLSDQALSIAKENAQMHEVDDRILFINADFCTHVLKDLSVDLIVANPPYLSQQELNEISPEVAGFEPVGALVGGEKGTELIEGSVNRIADALKYYGNHFMEIGYLQGKACLNIFSKIESFQHSVEIKKDISNHDRFVVAQKK